MSVAPTVLWGRAVSHVPGADGITRDTPAWLPYDWALMQALAEYEESLCPGCGMPLEEHKGKTAEDYAGGFITCPAVQALDADQVARAKEDGHKDAKPNPERARSWFAASVDEMRRMAEEQQHPEE